MILDCVVLNYNNHEVTRKCVERLCQISIIDHIVVIDNCSPDGSYEHLLCLASELVLVVKMEKNGGYGYGNNAGIRIAQEKNRADYVLIANPDTAISESTLLKLINILEQDEECAIVAPEAYLPTRKRAKKSAWHLPTYCDFLMMCSLILNRVFWPTRYPNRFFKGKTLAEVDCVSGALFLTRTSHMVEHGMYDENMFLYFEEIVLGTKLKRYGLKTYILLGTHYEHQLSVSIQKAYPDQKKRIDMARDSLLYVMQHYYGITGFRLKLAHAVRAFSHLEYRVWGALLKLLFWNRDSN